LNFDDHEVAVEILHGIIKITGFAWLFLT